MRAVWASHEQLALNAHNLRQRDEVLRRHEETLTKYADLSRQISYTIDRHSEELSMSADVLHDHDLKLGIDRSGSAAASSNRPPDPGDVETMNPREEVILAYENLMRRRDISMMNGDHKFVDALNRNLEDIADSLSIDSDEMDTGENTTYGAPSLAEEARSMGLLHQELVNQLETAAQQSNWEAADMYRTRMRQLEDLMLFLPDPDPVSGDRPG